MKNKKTDVVIIGGGTAGISSAQYIAERGGRACLIERATLGGRSVKTGLQGRRFLEEALKEGFSIKSEFHKIIEYCQSRMAELSAELESQLKSIGVEVLYGEGAPRGSRSVQVDGKGESFSIETGKIIIATGSRPDSGIHLPLDGQAILSPQDFWDAKPATAPSSVMITGSEEPSFEAARFFKSLGAKVFWVNQTKRLLPEAHESLSSKLEEIAKKEKIKVLPGKKLISHLKNDDNIDVSLEGGVKFSTEKIFIVEGRKPETKGLNLEGMGMRLGVSGETLTEENLETSVPGIFSAGSVLGRESVFGLSEEEGRVAAENAMGEKRNMSSDMTPRIIHSKPEMAWIGISADLAHHHGLRAIEGKAVDFGINHANGEFCKIVCDKESQRIIGAQLVTDHASELIHLISLCIRRGLKPQSLAKMNCFRSSSANGLRLAALECVKQLKKTSKKD